MRVKGKIALSPENFRDFWDPKPCLQGVVGTNPADIEPESQKIPGPIKCNTLQRFTVTDFSISEAPKYTFAICTFCDFTEN